MITIARGITIGRLAGAAGVNLETIRYYERIGLIPPPPRTQGKHRAYTVEHVRRLTFIRRARELGFRIEDIRTLLALARPDHLSCGEVKQIASVHLQDVRAKLADLIRLEAILSASVEQCTGEQSASCPVLDFLDS